MSPEESIILRLSSGKKPSAKSSAGVFAVLSPLSFLTKRTRYFHRNRRRAIRYGLIAGNLAVITLAGVVIIRHSGGNAANFSALKSAEESQVSNPLDVLSSTDIAVNVALMTRLPETGLIINEADSVSAELNATVSTHETVLKPQILSSDIKTKEDITEHTVAAGDTLGSLAARYGVTSDSIRWSNGLSGSSLKVGSVMLIPPVDGVVYAVKSGDTAAALAKKYGVAEEAIIRFNDAELTGLVADTRIVIPGGTVKAAPVVRRPYYAGFAFGNTAVYGYNGYVPGYCTWYVANKRLQIGRGLPANLGNASTWDNYAPQGWNRTPAPGAAGVTSERGAGHVVFVEEVRPDGSVLVSEMNRRRRYEITTRVFSAGEAASYKWIH